MAAAPSVADLVAWIGLTSPDPATEAKLGQALNAALARVDARCSVPSDWPEDARTGVMMYAHRISQRTNTPEGIASFGDQGGMRVTLRDPDVEELLGDYLKLDGF